MREIKFKARVSGTDGWVIGLPHSVYGTGIDSIQTEDRKIEYVRCDTLCQYSGMKDKNRVEAFEGDYDKDGNILIFCEECHGWQFGQLDIPSKEIVFCNNCEGNFMLLDHFKDFEIIGNIHD